MIRRFNYTGRRRIPRSLVRIRITGTDQRRRFDAELKFDQLGLPPQASVHVEAYYRAAYQRFNFGTVAKPRTPPDRWLDKIPVEKPLFRVKVVLHEHRVARIVAAADKVIPELADREQDDRISLLPVDYADLGDQVWKLDLDTDWPRLLLNNKLEGIREAARSGPEFLSLVYPQVFRVILEQALREERFDPDSDDDDWGTMWLRFACHELGRPRPPEASRQEDATDWIEEAVNAFCARVKAVSRLERLLADRGD